MGDIETVKAGEKLTVTYPGATPRKVEVTVVAACDVKDRGQWYCATHDEFFANQFDKDTHISTGSHKLAWNCFEHGIEEP